MGDLKISDQNNWGGPEQKIKFGGGLNLRGDLKFRGGLQHFISRKLAEANLLLNIKKKCSFMSACQNCLFVCLSLMSTCLSVKLQWVIQVTREIQGNS